MIYLTEATEHEYSIIQAIAHATWPQTFETILSPPQIQYMLEMMYSTTALEEQVTEKKHRFILAKDDKQCLGYASYQLHFNGLPQTKIHKIYILPEAQGKSIGKLFMHQIAERALQANDYIVCLNVNRNNPALQFYEKLGFTKTGQEDIDIGNGFLMEDFIMEKKLRRHDTC